METYKCVRESYSYQGTLSLGEVLTIANKKENVALHVIDDFFKIRMIHSQGMKRFQKLLTMLQFYLESDDGSGVAYQEALNEIERFRVILLNKYRKYFLEEELVQIEGELRMYENASKRRMIMLHQPMYQSKEQNNSRRSK